MRVLLVEDDNEVAEEVAAIVTSSTSGSQVAVARSRDTATEHLKSDFFDLIILDLTIPTSDGAKDELAIHGDNVFRLARSIAPGTPILVLTATPAEDFVPTMLAEAHQVDVWKTGKTIGTIDFLKKINLDELPAKISRIAEAVRSLSSVELNVQQMTVKPEYDRLLRIFARGCGGKKCTVSRLGGLSSAVVARLRITDSDGAKVYEAVVKLDDIPSVMHESQKYDTFITRLNHDATPRKIAILCHGAKASGGIFYQLASGFGGNAFSLVNQQAAPAVAPDLERLLEPWSQGVPETSKTIREIRQRILSDDDYALVKLQHDPVLNWTDEFETRPSQTVWCCVHGDLHGENVLAASDGSSVIIDYSDVDLGPRSVDALTLEFSLLFHPKSPLINGSWPTAAQAGVWFDLPNYLIDCPCPEYVRSVREWAERAAAGHRELAATAYAYFMRQLKYDSTDGRLALELMHGALNLYNTT